MCLSQESVIALAKILLPQIFEKMSMQHLRVLTAESSTMNTYLSGESVEVPPHSIGLLLEGFIKGHFPMEELIAPPAVLWPGKGNLSFLSHDGSGQLLSYSPPSVIFSPFFLLLFFFLLRFPASVL